MSNTIIEDFEEWFQINVSPLEQKWTQIYFPNLMNALKLRQRSEIRKEMEKIRNFYINSDIQDIKTCFEFIKSLRRQQIHAMEIDSNSKFSQINDKNSTLIKCQINGKNVFAFFDSGSDESFIGEEMAKLCNVWHLTDSDDKWNKKVIGLGNKSFIGRIHCIDIVVTAQHKRTISYPFMVMKAFVLPFLVLGRDFMNWFQCSIDFKTKTITLDKIDLKLDFIRDKCPICLTKDKKVLKKSLNQILSEE